MQPRSSNNGDIKPQRNTKPKDPFQISESSELNTGNDQKSILEAIRVAKPRTCKNPEPSHEACISAISNVRNLETYASEFLKTPDDLSAALGV